MFAVGDDRFEMFVREADVTAGAGERDLAGADLLAEPALGHVEFLGGVDPNRLTTMPASLIVSRGRIRLPANWVASGTSLALLVWLGL